MHSERYIELYRPENYRVNPKVPARRCTAHDLTWGPMGAQCLNCGSQAHHSFDLQHSTQPKGR